LITVASDSLLKTAIADGRVNADLQRKDIRRALGLPPKPAGSKRNGSEEEENTQEGEAPLDAVATWSGFSTADKQAILTAEGRIGLADLISPELMSDLVEHLLGLQAFGAATNTKRATALTAILRNALTADDSGGVRCMKAALQNFNLAVTDISVAVHRMGRGKRGRR
jgi:hypothetical protein